MENQEGGILKPKLAKKEENSLRSFKGLAEKLQEAFPFEPSSGQMELFQRMEDWLQESSKGKSIFILRGYAGTGKTALLGTLVKVLSRIPLKVQLMAPTGRASKVISSFTGKLALTIHKRIFRFEPDQDGILMLRRQKNTSSQTLFVVDEASMLGNHAEFGNKGILEELIRFAFEQDHNRVLFIGDTAQLPPVGTSLSPALMPDWLAGQFQVQVMDYELTEVVRQEADSGILENATRLRECIRLNQLDFKFKITAFPDVFKMNAGRILEGLDYAYQKFGLERTLVITRTNRQANRYNQAIRNRLLFREEEIENGDWIIVVKNNYAQGGEKNDFIANGELGRVGNAGVASEDYPLRLARMEIHFPELGLAENQTYVAALDLLHSDLPQLEEEKLRAFQEVILQESRAAGGNSKQNWKHLKSNPEANPLQVKFGYALTCHKAQGGQWDAVFIDHGYLREEEPDKEFFRWLYTALTRARKEVFLISPDARLLS